MFHNEKILLDILSHTHDFEGLYLIEKNLSKKKHNKYLAVRELRKLVIK